MHAAGRKRDPDAYFPLNIEFHEALAEAAANRALATQLPARGQRARTCTGARRSSATSTSSRSPPGSTRRSSMRSPRATRRSPRACSTTMSSTAARGSKQKESTGSMNKRCSRSTRQRRAIPLARQAPGRGVHRRRRPGLLPPLPRRRRDSQHRALHQAGLQRGGRRHDAELHLPEQHVDHHRHAGLAARHLGQLLPRHARPASRS